MQESKEYRVTVSGPELVMALKKFFPESLMVQSMPHRDGLTIKTFGNGIKLSWVRNAEHD